MRRRTSARSASYAKVERFERRRLLASFPAGPETRVNTYTLDDQAAPAVAAGAAGNYVVAWESAKQDGLSPGIFAQRYNAAGVPQGGELRVNTFGPGAQRAPAVAMDDDGDFVVVWQSESQDGSGLGVYAQRYGAAGATQGSEFRVNDYTTGDQSDPAVATDSAGNFVVTWTSAGQDGSGLGVFARRFDATGAPQGAEFRVNAHTTNNQQRPAVAMSAGGSFAVTWQSLGQFSPPPSDADVLVQRFDAGGVPLGGESRVFPTSGVGFSGPSMGMDGAGNFVVSWASWVRRFDAEGTPLGDSFTVGTGSSNVSVNAGGGFVIVWRVTSDGQRGGAGVFGRRFDASGAAQGPDFRVNSFTTGDQEEGVVAMRDDGGFVATWSSQRHDGSGSGVYAQRYRLIPDAQFGQLGDRVWNDTNGDGIQGATEGAFGTTVELYTADGAIASQVTTMNGGLYTLLAPASEPVYVQFVPPAAEQFSSNIPTRANRGTSDELDSDADRVTLRTPVITLASPGETNMTLDAGFVRGATLHGHVFFDHNNSGYHEQGEEELEGFEVYADFDADGMRDPDEPSAPTYPEFGTSEPPEFYLDRALPGTYRLGVVDQDRWVEGSATAFSPTVTYYVPVRTTVAHTAAVPRGAEFRASGGTTGNQVEAAVASDAEGNFVVVWSSNGTAGGGEYDVFARRFSATGEPLGGGGRVNQFTEGAQREPAIDMRADGTFVVAWTSEAQDGSQSGVYARRFDAAGMPASSEFRVNAYTPGAQSAPSVAVSDAGAFVVAWAGSGADDDSGIYARRFDAAGAPQGDAFHAHTDTPGEQLNPAAAMDADGDFVVAWASAAAGYLNFDVRAQRFDASGAPRGGETLVFAETTTRAVAAAMNAQGDYVIASDVRQSSMPVYYNWIEVQRFNPAGAPQGAVTYPVFVLDHSPRYSFASVAIEPDGDFVVAWQSTNEDGSGRGVYARRYNAAGLPQGAPMRVNSYTTDAQQAPAVAIDAAGDFVVAWESSGQDGSLYGIYAQRFGVTPGVVASEFAFETSPQRLRFAFDADVSASLGPDDVIVENLTAGQTIPAGHITFASYEAATNTATFAYTGPGGGSPAIAGVLPDGRYRATLRAAGVTSADGTPLAGDHEMRFAFLNADANRDARVSLADFNILAANFGQSNRTFSHGDFNFDGLVNLRDFNILASRMGRTVSPASGAPGNPFAAGEGAARDDDDDDENADLLA